MPRLLVLLGLLVASCAGERSQEPVHGPSVSYTSPAPSSDAPPPPPTVAPAVDSPPPPPPPPVQFSERPPIVFRGGPGLGLKPIAKQTSIIALSPDAKSFVLGGQSEARLVTPTLPNGIEHPVHVASALFSGDGKHVAIWSGMGLFVLDVASGRRIASTAIPTCAARFAAPGELVFHGESRAPDARLWRMTIGPASPRPLGAGRAAETCHASLDGTHWLIDGSGARSYVDGTTGSARGLGKEAESAILSPGGDRYCSGDDSGYACVRLPDGRREQVWRRQSSHDYNAFDLTGTRALIQYADGPDGVRDAFALVDFREQSVRPLRAVKWTSGSMFQLTPGGALLTVGSSRGLNVYDVQRAQRRVAAKNPLYGNFVFPYHPRRLVAGTDEPMDLFLVDVP
jgi:hypothetical protein